MKKNGFTLVELLTVLVILSILMMITIVGFTSYINRANQTYYKDLEETTKEAAMDFFSDHRNYYPKQAGDKREINIQDLISNKYLEQVVDDKKLPCSGKVTVQKLGNNKYDYKVCLKCPSSSKDIGDGC